MIKKMHRVKCVKMYLRSLQCIEKGSITLTTPRGKKLFFDSGNDGVKADMTVHDWSWITQTLARGDVGLGETFIEKKWDSSDPANLITFFLDNEDALTKFFDGNIWNRILFVLNHILKSNTKKGSKENIKAHYDVGNDFYKLWLDPTMTYSSALYENKEAELEQAQISKYKRILNKLEKENSHILEVGCGWGGFAEVAAQNNHKVTGLTVSPSQHEFAKKRLDGKNADIRLQDYRDVKGNFDYIVSIEMFEAVGENYWNTYFENIKDKLKSEGKAIIQTITIDDNMFDDYRKRSDFIRQYTFPGGMLPSMIRFKEEAEKVGLACKEVFFFGQDYAKTLREWLERINSKRDEIKNMGYSEEFLRSWTMYICMCIAAFNTGRTNVMQVELAHA